MVSMLKMHVECLGGNHIKPVMLVAVIYVCSLSIFVQKKIWSNKIVDGENADELIELFGICWISGQVCCDYDCLWWPASLPLKRVWPKIRNTVIYVHSYPAALTSAGVLCTCQDGGALWPGTGDQGHLSCMYATRHAKKGLRMCADSVAPDQSVHPRRLIWELHFPLIGQWAPFYFACSACSPCPI